MIFIQGEGTTRSEKRLVAAGRVHEILTPEYLNACCQAHQILPCYEYMAIDEETIQNAKRVHSTGGLYKDKYVFAGPSATGTKRGHMPWQQFKGVVVACGGTFVATLGKIQDIDPTKLIVVHGPDHKIVPKLLTAIADGARELNLPTDFFHEVLAQNVVITNSKESKVELGKEQPRPKRETRQTRKPTARKPKLPMIDENLPGSAVSSSKPAHATPAKATPAKATPAKAKSTGVPSQSKPASKQAPPKSAGAPSPSKPIREQALPKFADKQAPPQVETTNLIIESAKKSSPRIAIIEHLKDVARNPTLMFSSKVVSPSDPWIRIISLDMTISPRRSLSNSSVGDSGRMFLGANGRFAVQECPNTLRRRVAYFNQDNEVTFLAIVPQNNFHTVVKGNSGDEPAFYWDAVNIAHEVGGTTLKNATLGSAVMRRVTFIFDSPIALHVALYATLYGNMEAVVEFFDKRGRYFVDKETKPPHKIVAQEAEMDVDLEENKDGKTEDELYAEYGYGVYEESQAY